MSELVCRTLELLAESKGAFASAVKNIFDTKTMATLKISDLSVGDWVMVEWPDGERWRGRLTRLSVTGGVEVCCANGKHVRCSSDFISAIPITAEILAANGFGKKTFTQDQLLRIVEPNGNAPFICYRWDSERVIIERSNDYMLRVKTKYIHQLQHALRLAGVDKEINL